MLAAGDANLVQRDKALPGLAILLDPGRMAALIARLFACPSLEALTPNYVRYKPGTSCLVGYHARAGSVALPIYARTHTAEASIKVTKVLKRPHTPGPLGAGAAITLDPPIAVFAFPNDHELRVAKDLFEQNRRTAWLGQMLPMHPALHAGELHVLRYKPERRLVARLTGHDATRAVLRAHAEGAVGAFDTNQVHSAIALHGTAATPSSTDADPTSHTSDVRLPRRLGGSIDDRVAIYEWIDGEPLDAVLASPVTATTALDRVGQSLARWHRQARERTPDRRAPIESSHDAAAAIATIDDSLSDRATALAARIDATLAGINLPLTRIHGDFSAEQVILTDPGIAFIDLDRSTIASGLEDLATFRARLIADAIAGRWPLAAAAAWSERLTASYEREHGNAPTPRATAALTARALLRLATEPFRKRLPEWPTKAAQILAAAAEACP